MEKIKKDKIIAAGKEAYKDGDLFAAEYSFVDRDGNFHDMYYIFREPNAGEIAFYQQQLSVDQTEANKNLLRSLVVSPPSSEVLDELGDNHTAVSTFIQDYVNPLYGTIKHKEPIRKI